MAELILRYKGQRTRIDTMLGRPHDKTHSNLTGLISIQIRLYSFIVFVLQKTIQRSFRKTEWPGENSEVPEQIARQWKLVCFFTVGKKISGDNVLVARSITFTVNSTSFNGHVFTFYYDGHKVNESTFWCPLARDNNKTDINIYTSFNGQWIYIDKDW